MTSAVAAFEDAFIPEPNSGCWLWLRSCNNNGYGQAGYGHTTAHRRAWELYRGPIPDGMSVLHKCDVRSCVNPDHLFLGTQQDNLADMRSKGRGVIPDSPRGEGHHFAVLTDEIVLRMRAEFAAGRSIQRIADDLNIHPATARDAIRRNTWKHLP